MTMPSIRIRLSIDTSPFAQFLANISASILESLRNQLESYRQHSLSRRAHARRMAIELDKITASHRRYWR